jgi:hypothetical protein
MHNAAVAATQDLQKALRESPKPSSSLARLAAQDDVFGSLQLAINCSDPDVAAKAPEFLVQKIYEHDQSLFEDTTKGAAAVSRLVVTAVTRQHTGAVHHMASTPALLQEVDTRAHQSVILHLIKERDSFSLTWLLGSHESSIAHQLSAEATVQLLQAAVEYKCDVEPLCAVPAAQQLRSDDVLQLLQAAVAKDTTSMTGRLLQLPAARQFDGDMWAQLLETAIRKGTSVNRLKLLRMQPVHQLSPSSVTHLLEVAIEHDDEMTWTRLFRFELAQLLSLSSLERLVAAAEQRGPDSYTWMLFRAPAAAQFTATKVAALILSAAERGKDYWAAALCELPAAQQITADTVAKLVLTTIKHGSKECAWMRSLPAFKQMGSNAVFELLQAAVSKGPAAARYIAVICELSAAKQLSSESLQQLLLAANEQNGQVVSSGQLPDWLVRALQANHCEARAWCSIDAGLLHVVLAVDSNLDSAMVSPTCQRAMVVVLVGHAIVRL